MRSSQGLLRKTLPCRQVGQNTQRSSVSDRLIVRLSDASDMPSFPSVLKKCLVDKTAF